MVAGLNLACCRGFMGYCLSLSSLMRCTGTRYTSVYCVETLEVTAKVTFSNGYENGEILTFDPSVILNRVAF